RDGALCARVEFADRLDRVAEEFDTNRAWRLRGENVDDAAADRELARHLDHLGSRVADRSDVSDEFFERDFCVCGQSAGERKVDVGILIAPEGGAYRRD